MARPVLSCPVTTRLNRKLIVDPPGFHPPEMKRATPSICRPRRWSRIRSRADRLLRSRQPRETDLEQDNPATLIAPSAAADSGTVSRPGFAARWRSWRRPLTTLVILLVSWELIGRYVLTNRLFFAPLSDVVVAAIHL